MTLAEWDKSIDQLPKEQKEKLIEALETLKGWEDFHKEFKWTGMFVLQTSLKHGLRREAA